MSFFENWKEFRIRAEKQNLSPACKVIYYELLGKFNDAFWTDEISLTDNELMRLTRIRSRQTIIDAKSRLKLSGLIDFTTSKYSGTTYKLVQLASTSWSEQTGHQAGHQTGHQTGQREPDSYTHVREDIKTLRQEDTSSPPSARARADVINGKTPPDTREDAEVSDGVRHCWIQATYTNPTELDEIGLAALEKEFGSTKVYYAIIEANRRKDRDRINLAFVEHILRNGDKPQKPKGVVRNEAGQSNRQSADDDRFGYRARYDDL